MNMVSTLSALGVLCSLFSLGLLIFSFGGVFHRPTTTLFIAFVTLNGFIAVSNFLQWSGIYPPMDRLGDFIGTLMPLSWAFIFYAIIQELTVQDLLAKEEQYRDLFDNAEELILKLSPQGEVVKSNKSVMETLGYSGEELMRLEVRNLLHPDDVGEFQETFLRVLKGSTEKNRQFTLLTKDGSQVAVEGNLSSRIEGNHPVFVRCIFRNISDRKVAEEALRMERNHLETITGNIGAGLAIISRDFRTLWANGILKTLFGEVEGKTCYETYNQRSQICPGCGALEVFEKGVEKAVNEQVGTDADGNLIWSQIIATPIRDQEGQVKAVLELVVPITERKRMEEELHRSEHEKRIILDSLMENVIYTDVTMKIVWANKTACDSVGMKREDVIGRYCYTLWGERDDPCHDCIVLKAIRTGRRQEIEKETPDGRTWLNQGYPITDASGEAIGGLEVSLDITERKRVEEELASHRTRLEELVMERTRQLEEARDELVKRERLAALGQLTATVSHELRNPLGVIYSSAYYLQRILGNSGEKISKHLQRITNQVMMCNTIVDDLLEYTRGRSPEMFPGDLNAALQKILDDLASVYDFPLIRDLSPELPQVSFDAGKIRRVVTNLLENARQALTPQQQGDQGSNAPHAPWVRIATRAEPGTVFIQVEDNGVGMNEETARRAFEPLFTTRARGTGLGLAIVRNVAEEHGGHVSLESVPGGGTRVTVSLPAIA